jgi:hypothetical protein
MQKYHKSENTFAGTTVLTLNPKPQSLLVNNKNVLNNESEHNYQNPNEGVQ